MNNTIIKYDLRIKGCENMDIASVKIGINQVPQQNSVQLAVINMAMDTSKVEATNMVEMMNSKCVEPYKGQNIDAIV